MKKKIIEGRELDVYTLQVIKHLMAGKVANIKASVKLLESGYTQSPTTGEQITDFIKRDINEISNILSKC